MKWLILSLLLTTLSSAMAAVQRPPNFSYQQSTAVFVDFQTADYEITYDITQRSAAVKATMQMTLPEAGHALFDLIEAPTSVTVNGQPVTTAEVKTPSNETTLRVLTSSLSAGSYTMVIEVPLKNLVSYISGGVKSAFWVTDLNDRFYLERYIPTNLEYDNIKMNFFVNYIGRTVQQHVFANGNVSWVNENRAKIEFPDYFTVNSLYFHTTPVSTVDVINFTHQSSNGRLIPVAIYAARGMDAAELPAFKSTTLQVLAELEQDYGAFRHNSVTIYNANLSSMGLGGMEYAGATVTNIGSLGHELFHSYFARGMTPANGNAGWIDEALASWRDDGYDRRASLSGSSRMAAHPIYTRKTDTAAYGFGARFMAFLDNKFTGKGGLKPFMNSFLQANLFVPVTTEQFIAAMESFYNEPMQAIFQQYVYDRNAVEEKSVHPIHRKMGAKELAKIL